MTHSHGDAQHIEDDVTRIEEPLRSEFKAVFALGMLERWKGAPAEGEDLIPADIQLLVENAAERAVELAPPIVLPYLPRKPPGRASMPSTTQWGGHGRQDRHCT